MRLVPHVRLLPVFRKRDPPELVEVKLLPMMQRYFSAVVEVQLLPLQVQQDVPVLVPAPLQISALVEVRLLPLQWQRGVPVLVEAPLQMRRSVPALVEVRLPALQAGS